MKAIKETVCLGIFYLLLVTTYSSFSYIATFIYDHQNLPFLGPLLLATNYATFLVANFFASSVSLPFVTQMKIAAMCYTINYAVELIEFFGAAGIILRVIASMLGGFGAALVWVCYGGYMTELCNRNNEEEYKGRYFAILNLITFGSTMLGAIITTFCLGKFSNQVYFLSLTVLGFLSLVFCHFFVKDVPKS